MRAASVTIQAPRRCGGKVPDLKVNVVLVSEIDAPEGDAPVEWLLLSSLPIDSVAAVNEIIEAYRKRLLIEVFFRVLKSGCGIEVKRFERCDRHLSLLALAIIIAWRVQSLTQAAKHEPEASASKYFEASEWQAAWAVVKREKHVGEEAPRLAEMVEIVVRLDQTQSQATQSAWSANPMARPPPPARLSHRLVHARPMNLCVTTRACAPG